MYLCGKEVEFRLDGKNWVKRCGMNEGHPLYHTVMFRCEEHDVPYTAFFTKDEVQLFATITNGDGTVPSG